MSLNLESVFDLVECQLVLYFIQLKNSFYLLHFGGMTCEEW